LLIYIYIDDILYTIDDKDIKTARRRLSVMSDNKLVEGFENAVNLDENDAVS